jgi:hypothetical protein
LLIEAVVVLAALMVVLSMFFSGLQSLTKAEQRVQGLVNNQETVRFALGQMGRELRAANPLDSLPAATSYPNQITFELGPTPGVHQYVRWLYDTLVGSPTYESIMRQVMSGPSSAATVVSQRIVVTRVHNIETNTAIITYYDSQHADLVALNPTTPANVANCAIAVHIQVNSDAQPGPQPFSEDVDVELRNRLPGGSLGCVS